MMGAVALMKAYPQTRVAIMSGSGDHGAASTALEVGLHGFLPKTMSGRALVNALRLIGCGETYFPSNLFQRSGASAGGPSLTRRESDVLAHLRSGATNKEIAAELGLEEPTVKGLVRRLAAKFDARNRTEIALKATAASN